MSTNLEVNPNLVNEVYKQRLAQATDENILLSAAVTQLQNQITQLDQTIKALQTVPTNSDVVPGEVDVPVSG